MRKNINQIIPLVIVFTMISGLLVAFSSALQSKGFNIEVLIYANILLIVISMISYFMQAKALSNKNPNVFIRSVMGGMMMKMFVCVIAVFLYVSYAGPQYNKRSVFAALFLYLVYLATEVAVVMKMNKRKHA